jgi:branched-chain amino acid aminotransferase
MASVPFDQLEGEIWFNGEFVPWKDAKIHVLTHGLHYASAVFEGERAYGGEIFKLTEHTERLHTSADILGFKIPYSVAEIDQACVELLARQGFEDAYVRPIAWRGSEMMGVSAQANRINLAIAIWQWPSYFKPEERMKGIRLDMAEYRRPDPRTAPSRSKAAGLYMICTLSKHRAEERGYADALMLDWRDQVAEATGANVFFVKDGKIHTPTPDCFLPRGGSDLPRSIRTGHGSCPRQSPSSPLRWMNSKKIGPITVLEKICSRILVMPPSTTPSPSIRMPCFFISRWARRGLSRGHTRDRNRFPAGPA